MSQKGAVIQGKVHRFVIFPQQSLMYSFGEGERLGNDTWRRTSFKPNDRRTTAESSIRLFYQTGCSIDLMLHKVEMAPI